MLILSIIIGVIGGLAIIDTIIKDKDINKSPTIPSTSVTEETTTETTENSVEKEVKIISLTVYVREEPNKSSEIITIVTRGQKLPLISEEIDTQNKIWYEVKIDGETGYIYSEYAEIIE